MEIILTDKLTRLQAHHLFGWREQVFPSEGKRFSWSKLQWHILALSKDSEPVAHMGYSDFTIYTDDQRENKIVGVGGVVVRPEWQLQNIPKELFSFLHNSEHARSLSNTFSLFSPKRLERYYQRHGYEPFHGSYSFLQENIRVATNMFTLMSYGIPLTADSIHVDSEPW